jgi:Tol biopolymer transport system component
VGSLDSKESKLLLHTRSEAIYTSGRLIFLRQNALMAQAFDDKRLELTGEANPIASDVQEDEPRAYGLFSASQNGLLTYAEGSSGVKRQLIWLDRSGKKLGELAGADAYDDVRFSPEGKRLAVTVQTGGRDVWIEDISRAVKTRLTFGSASSQSDEAAVWSPDGRWIAYDSVREGKYGIYRKAADGSGNEEVLLQAGDQPRFVTDWSADGQIAYYEMAQGVWNIWMLPLSGDKKPYPFVKLPFSSVFGRFSPDGKWLAYCSAESGRMEVYVVSFPSAGSKRQISSDGGCQAIWRRDAKEIFYVATDNRVMVAGVRTAASSLQIGMAKPLFETRPSRTGGWSYDVAPDGQRFLVNYLPEQPGGGITLVVNWDAEFKKQ